MRDDSGQIHTIEGIAAALILIITLLFVTQSITFIAPQTEKSVDINLSVMSADILTQLNRGNEFHPSELKSHLESWNGNTTAPGGGVAPGEPGISDLDTKIRAMLPGNINYNVSIYYADNGVWASKDIISHGTPGDNAITSSEIVTLNIYDDQYITRSSYWGTRKSQMPKVIVVRLSIWYL